MPLTRLEMFHPFDFSTFFSTFFFFLFFLHFFGNQTSRRMLSGRFRSIRVVELIGASVQVIESRVTSGRVQLFSQM